MSEKITRTAAVREFERLRRCGEETLRLETVIAILMHLVPSAEENAPKRGRKGSKKAGHPKVSGAGR